MAKYEKTKIILIVPSLRAGGAERVLSFLSNSIDSELFLIHFVVIGFKKDAKYDYPIGQTTFLNKSKARQAIFALINLIKIHNPKIVMSSIGHVNSLLGLFSLFYRDVKFIGRIASVNSVRANYSNFQSNWFSRFVFSFAHKRLDQIICQSQDMLDDLHWNNDIPLDQMVLINNPITSIPENIKNHSQNIHVLRFITVGRLTDVKGHSRILQCLSKLKKYDFRYTIVGSGNLENKIRDSVNDLGLSKYVSFVGHTNKVNDLLIQHDVFLQGSFVEGFPNAALESCVVGVPVVAFDVPGGTKEIISNGVNGYLVKTEEDFISILNDKSKLLKLEPKEIAKYTRKKFATEKILKQYQTVFRKLVE